MTSELSHGSPSWNCTLDLKSDIHVLQVLHINLQHFYPLKPAFFFLRSHLCPLSLNTAPSQVLFISFHEYLWNLFFLHFTAVRKKPYSKLLFLKKKAPHLPSCSPFCLSLIHFPHKQILLKHRLDHVTHPLKVFSRGLSIFSRKMQNS